MNLWWGFRQLHSQNLKPLVFNLDFIWQSSADITSYAVDQLAIQAPSIYACNELQPSDCSCRRNLRPGSGRSVGGLVPLADWLAFFFQMRCVARAHASARCRRPRPRRSLAINFFAASHPSYSRSSVARSITARVGPLRETLDLR